MLRKVMFALIGLALMLLLDSLLSPARATLGDSSVYSWGYTSIGSDRVACKQIISHPKAQKATALGQQPVKIQSTIVSDRYCAHLPKPL